MNMYDHLDNSDADRAYRAKLIRDQRIKNCHRIFVVMLAGLLWIFFDPFDCNPR